MPACLVSKDLQLKGYAKEIKRIKIPTNYYFLIINPNVELHTKDVFRTYSDFLDLQRKFATQGNENEKKIKKK